VVKEDGTAVNIAWFIEDRDRPIPDRALSI
jgi:hypothetical protein